MPVQRRKAGASAAAPASPPPKQAAAGGKSKTAAAKAGGKNSAAAGEPPATSRGAFDGVLAAVALAVALLSAICEWPIYLAYEKDFKRPAVAFTLNLGITAIISLAVTASPQVRSLKKSARALAAAADPPAAAAVAAAGDVAAAAAAAAAPRPPMKKAAKRQLVAGVTIMFISLYYGFGLYGPSGALTATALSAAMFLGMP